MSRRRCLVRDAAGDQGQEFAKRMRENRMIALVVLGFRVEQVGGVSSIAVGSLWGNRLEQSASDAERVELERLLGDLSKLLVRWIEHDRERLD
jgi:hypothetical protein